MSKTLSDLPVGLRRRLLLIILVSSLCINAIGIRWGLPNGDRTWASDALTPTVPMSVVKHMFGGDPPNSGWFYWKYPLGHPLLLAAAQAPYLVWLKITDQFQSPRSTYPFGFAHPESALEVLALVTRAVSVLMGVGVVVLAYDTTMLLFGSVAGLCAAVLVAGCYPMVFYAHTTNVDTPMLFWMALTVAAALRAADSGSRATAALVGIASAMAVFTKEQSIGLLPAVPVVWLLRRGGGGLQARAALRQAAYATVGFLAVTIVVGNLWWNPAGFVNRWRFLFGVLPGEVRDKYAPYQFLLQSPAGFSLAHEIGHLLKLATTVSQALTLPVLLLCAAGVIVTVWQVPRLAAVPLLLAVTYYVLALRAFALLPVRYTMPLLYCLLILGGAGCSTVVARIRALAPVTGRRVMLAALTSLLGFALLPGLEIDRLFVSDSRYAAEAWLQAYTAAGARVEVYQPHTYLPRFGAALSILQVPLPERSVTSFRERHPDLVVLSAGGKAGLIGRVVHEWQQGQPITADSPQAKEFFERLRDGELEYRRAAEFRTRPIWVNPRINSLSPTITIFVRDGQA